MNLQVVKKKTVGGSKDAELPASLKSKEKNGRFKAAYLLLLL